MSEASRAKVTVRLKGRKNWVTSPPTRPMGRKTATVVMVEEVMALETSLVPSMTAVPIGSRSCRWWRKMFSSTTMASSTTRPTATARPPRVMMFRLTPPTSMSRRAAITLSGMLMAATTCCAR